MLASLDGETRALSRGPDPDRPGTEDGVRFRSAAGRQDHPGARPAVRPRGLSELGHPRSPGRDSARPPARRPDARLRRAAQVPRVARLPQGSLRPAGRNPHPRHRQRPARLLPPRRRLPAGTLPPAALAPVVGRRTRRRRRQRTRPAPRPRRLPRAVDERLPGRRAEVVARVPHAPGRGGDPRPGGRPRHQRDRAACGPADRSRRVAAVGECVARGPAGQSRHGEPLAGDTRAALRHLPRQAVRRSPAPRRQEGAEALPLRLDPGPRPRRPFREPGRDAPAEVGAPRAGCPRARPRPAVLPRRRRPRGRLRGDRP